MAIFAIIRHRLCGGGLDDYYEYFPADEMRKWTESQVASGCDANASDYIRDLIRSN